MTESEIKKKETISFSEIYTIYNCAFKHHWLYVLKNKQPDTIFSVFGTAIHKAIEDKWKNNVQNSWITMLKILILWHKIYDEKDIANLIVAAKRIYKDFFPFMKEKFPDYELYDIEFKLDEQLPNIEKRFKGYIDLILFNPKDETYLIIDFKTTKTGWYKEQMSDTKKLYQVILYKKFFMEKMKIDEKKIECYYLLMKRAAPKKDKYCLQLVPITSGKKKVQNASEWLNEMAEKIETGLKIKNPTTCQFCVCGASKKENIWKKKKI